MQSKKRDHEKYVVVHGEDPPELAVRGTRRPPLSEVSHVMLIQTGMLFEQ
jgi:hypothetical protein